jgi:hypothetical protein
MGSEPDTELENPLKLLRFVEPPIAVADGMSRKIIIYWMLATERMGEYMIGFPLSFYETSADVTSAACLGKDLFSFEVGKLLSEHTIAQFEFVLPPSLAKRA